MFSKTRGNRFVFVTFSHCYVTGFFLHSDAKKRFIWCEMHESYSISHRICLSKMYQAGKINTCMFKNIYAFTYGKVRYKIFLCLILIEWLVYSPRLQHYFSYHDILCWKIAKVEYRSIYTCFRHLRIIMSSYCMHFRPKIRREWWQFL